MTTQGDTLRPKSRTKTIHSLASPFPEPSWPQISSEDQNALLDLLCLLLKDVGEFRKSLTASKGKRLKRKKQKEVSGHLHEEPEVLPRPEIESSILIGFNNVQRRLESMIRKTVNVSVAPSGTSQISPERISNSALQNSMDLEVANDESATKEYEAPKKDNDIVAVFVDRSSQPPIMTRQLPDMMAAAAVSTDEKLMLWLIALPSGAGARLAEVVGVPRLGFCGVLADAPGSYTLLHYLKSHVQPVQALIADAATSAQFFSLKVERQLVEVADKSSDKRPRNQHSPAKDELELRKSKKRRKNRRVNSHHTS